MRDWRVARDWVPPLAGSTSMTTRPERCAFYSYADDTGVWVDAFCDDPA
ncbi:MAG TPA: hypothetical protein VI854_01885 [Acidimicrobiia bacterium]|nr:hypothetical protein [Acidimicrobiia bacterium]